MAGRVSVDDFYFPGMTHSVAVDRGDSFDVFREKLATVAAVPVECQRLYANGARMTGLENLSDINGSLVRASRSASDARARVTRTTPTDASTPAL
jgi:hypothetical protein